jgi:hypothetical protein
LIGGRDPLDAASSLGGWGLRTLRSWQDLVDAYQPLTRDDPTYQPNYRPPGAPEVPSNCEGVEGCGSCYQDAHAELNRVRTSLERLRVAYKATKDFATKSIAFGDTASGIHAVTGLAWQVERDKITKALEELNHTYDAKHAELIPRLEKALRAISECERKFFGTKDWYNRYGFIYYTFMSDRYKRAS